jgi:MFS-type transporter involved in bile tolerance (Atg22 family)
MANHDHEINVGTRKPLAVVGAILGIIAGPCLAHVLRQDRLMVVTLIVCPLVGIAAPYLSKQAGFGVVLAYAVIIALAAGAFG